MSDVEPVRLRTCLAVQGVELADIESGVEIRFSDTLTSIETSSGPRPLTSADTLVEILREISP